MEYYILDENMRRTAVIENFESFIWTERWQDLGDFQIITKSVYQTRSTLAAGTWITRQGSYYVGTILTITDAVADDGTRNLTIVGSMLEALLQDRVAMPALTDTTTVPSWVVTDTPGNIVRYMFQQVCVLGCLNPNDTIPFYTSGTLLPAGSIPEETEIITVSAQPDTLFNTIQQLCVAYFLGFRLVRNGDTSQVYFEVYTGNDLTSDQTERPAVIFDANLENLIDATSQTSTATVKTVAYVFAANGSAVAYATYASSDDSGANRRVLLVNSNNSDDASDELTAALHAEGVIALAGYRSVYNFDGELPAQIPYIYGVDYNLGDLVEQRDSDGIGSQMFVSEQIFSTDNTGTRAYPTLTVKELILPGSWNAYDPTVDWDELDDSVTWDNITSS